MSLIPPRIDYWRDWRDAFLRMKVKARGDLDRVGVRFRLTKQGELIQLKVVDYDRPNPPRGNRAKITGFSEGSRWNLIKKTMRWDWRKIGPSVFVTLTYPDGCAKVTVRERNTHRYLFHRKVESYRGCNTPILWRVEYAERKSGELVGESIPHWHMLLFGVDFLPYQIVNQYWKEIIGVRDYVRTDVRAVANAGGVARYLTKYLSKEASSHSLVRATKHNITGRHWGVLREKCIPVHPEYRIASLPDEIVERLYKIVEERQTGVSSKIKTSFTAFGQLGCDIISELKKYGIDLSEEKE